MDLVLIHGRAQEGRSSEEIRKQWIRGLEIGFENADLEKPEFSQVRTPFYGDELDELTASLPKVSVVRRGDSPPDTVDHLVSAIVQRMAARLGLTEAEIQEIVASKQKAAVERGPLDWNWVHAIAAYLDRNTPWLAGNVLDRFVADVQAYLHRPDVRKAVHEIVSPAIGAEPSIVISHSLGTVVAYWILAKELQDNASVKLFLTVGSPLGINAIKTKIVPPPRNFPEGVEKWVNITDPQDIVALTEKLNEKTFLPNIKNISDIENGDQPHAIERYLADPRVAHELDSAMSIE